MKNDSLQKIQGTVTKVLTHLREDQKRVAWDLSHGGRQPQQWDMLVQRLVQKASQHRGFKISKAEAAQICTQHGFQFGAELEGTLVQALTAYGVELVKDGDTEYTRPGYEVKDREAIRTGSKFIALAGKDW